jgi:hypothetical protein
MKIRVGLCVVLAMLAGVFSSAVAGVLPTGVVYELGVAGTVVFPQPVSEGTDVVVKVSFTANTLINIARGRAPTDAVPANEKLALELYFVGDGSPIGQLAVYDTAGGSNLAVIADLDVSGALATKTGKGIVAMSGGINETGGFTDGWVAMTGKATVNEASLSPLVAFSTTGVQGVLRGFDGENFFEVIISKAKAKVLGNIGSVSPPVAK